MSVSVSAVPRNACEVGGCSSCSSRDQVWQIRFGENELRACADCRGVLFQQLGGKSKCQPVLLEFKKLIVPTDPSISVLNMVATTKDAEWRETFHTDADARIFLRGVVFAESIYGDPLPAFTFTEDSVVKRL